MTEYTININTMNLEELLAEYGKDEHTKTLIVLAFTCGERNQLLKKYGAGKKGIRNTINPHSGIA